MSVANFKPTIWSSNLVAILQENFDITSLFNREYEGEIREQGDQVKIQKFGGVTIGDYPATADIAVQQITSSTQTLTINKKKYFGVEVGEIDEIQANVSLMATVLEDAAAKLQVQMNIDVMTDALTGALTANIFDTGATIDLDDFKLARKLLNRADVPKADRWAIIHPDAESDLLGNSNFINADKYGSDVPLLTGEIGSLLGFRIVVSTSVKTTAGKYQNLFMHRSACAFAMQTAPRISAVEMEKRFGNLVKGFTLYGTKLIQPAALVVIQRTV